MLLKFIRKLIAPRRCLVCESFIEDEEFFCEGCIETVNEQKIQNLSRKIEFCDEVHSSYYYYGKMRNAVLYAKYKSPKNLIDFFIEKDSEGIIKIINESNIDFIIPAPFHKSKLYKYEYDLPSEMAKELSKKVNLAVVSAVVKMRKTPKQQDLSDEQRKVNLINAFEVVQDIKGKNILLLDDIITTGNTISQLALTLKGAGASRVIAYSFAIRKE